jgi:MoxR-like ATPase
MHVPSLMKGEERIEPRSIITAPFKFINEFQRGNYKIYNTLLGLFSEGFVSIRDRKFKTEDYVAVLDANPFDSGSVEIPAALMDRITASVNMRSVPGTQMLDMFESAPDFSKVRNVLSPADMRKIWGEVERVAVPDKVRLLMALIHSYFSTCVYGDKAVMDHRYVATMCSSCRYKTEPCAMVLEPLGHRWWKDVVRISRARAYINGRGEVSVEDVFFSAKFALQHRIRTRERVRTLYQSKEQWVESALSNAELRLRKVWLPALKGNEDAKKVDERTLSALEV